MMTTETEQIEDIEVTAMSLLTLTCLTRNCFWRRPSYPSKLSGLSKSAA